MRTRLWLLALPLFTACPNRPQEPLPAPPPATITTFTVTPNAVSQGDTVTVEWGTTNATAISLEQIGAGPIDTAGKLSGRITMAIERTTAFVLSAQGAGGGDLKTVTAIVDNQVRGALFTALPATVDAEQPTTLVWSAPGAQRVAIREVNGALIDLGTQATVGSGTLEVRPAVTTTYELTAGTTKVRTTVVVNPTVKRFAAQPSVATFGEPLTLSWDVKAAASVRISRAGAPVALVADGGVTGTFTDTTFPEVPPDGFLTYVLEANDGTGRTMRQALDVPMGGGVEITSLTLPRYALVGSPFTIAWTTRGGTTAEVLVDGQRRHLVPNPTQVNAGSFTLPAPTQSAVVTFIVRNGRGGEARETRVIDGVGPLAYNQFTADKTTIANPGEPVTLRWSVSNARNVRITNSSQRGFSRLFTGNVDSGTLVVFPNSRGSANRITYTLRADNGTGSPAITRSLEVLVNGTQARLQINRRLPVGARATLAGASIPEITGVLGVGGVERNVAGDAFVDIRKTGTAVTFGTLNAAVVALPSAFEATLFGSPIAATQLNISRYGWFRPTTSTTVTPGPAENDTTIGTLLEPLAIAPYWRNLDTADKQVHWQVDDVADARRIIVQWSGVRSVDGPVDGRATFQAQLYSNGRIVFAYRELKKVPGGTVGVTNFSENNELLVTTPIASGDTFRLFGTQPFPATLKVENAPYAAFGIVGSETMDLEATGSILTTNQLVISEIHPRPSPAVTNGEWVEIRNQTDGGFDLSDWEIDFGGPSFTFPQGTSIPPLGRVLVAQSADLGDPNDPDGGILLANGTYVARPAPNHIYPSTVTMSRSGGFARLGILGAEYFRLTYPSGGRVGAALGFEDERFSYVTYDLASTRLSCAAVRPLYGSNGQHGTPGLPNQTCWPYDHWQPVGTPYASIATTGTRVIFDPADPTYPAEDEGLFVLNLQQPLMLYGQETTTLTISSNGFVVPYAMSPCVDPTFGDVHACLVNPTNPGAPNGNRPSFVIAPFWTDLDGTRNMGTGVFYRVLPSGDVLISWENTTMWMPTTSTAVLSLNFQVLLSVNGDIEFRFGNMSGSGTVSTYQGANLARGQLATTWVDVGRAADRINANSLMPGVAANTHFTFRMSMARP